MKLIKIVLILFLGSYNVCQAQGTPLEFFNRYKALSDNFDTEIADLYSDTAKISTYRVYPHGLERSMELNGKQWKSLLTKVMPIAKAKNDKSTFSNIKITKLEKGFRLKADRYSTVKCYTDTGYHIVIEPFGRTFLIVEEYLETQPQSNCVSEDNNLGQLLENSKVQLMGHLPMMVDEETRLDSVSVDSDTFSYIFTLVSVSPDEFTPAGLIEILRPVNVNSSCKMPSLKPLIDAGAALTYTYKDKNGQKITTMTITKKDCEKLD